jgi:hypothetical protein
MKCFIAAVSFAIAGAPAVAAEVGAPYEQLNVDRALPQVAENVMAPDVRDGSAPFEQLTLDRALPTLPQEAIQVAENIRFADATSVGSNTRSDVGIVRDAPAESPQNDHQPWRNDHNFIAPAQ